jgi:hypothetical protein
MCSGLVKEDAELWLFSRIIFGSYIEPGGICADASQRPEDLEK